MKKLLTILLATTMVLGCVACGGETTPPVDDTPLMVAADSVDLLTRVWATYGEDEQFFAMGGHFEAPVDNAPGAYDITKTEDLSISFCIPTDVIPMIDDAATIMHAMNANSFSAAAYHVLNVDNVQTVIEGIKEKTVNNQWMCGFPDKLMIVTVGEDYVVSAFGVNDIMDVFQAKLTEVYGDAVNVVVEVNLAE